MADGLHGGDIYGERIEYDFSVSINPLGIPRKVQEALQNSICQWDRYPDPACRRLTQRLAEHHKTEADRIVCGNGAADLIYRLAFQIGRTRALLPVPTFSEYERALETFGCTVRHWQLKEENGYLPDLLQLAQALKEGEALFLCNPNNPTGRAVEKEQVEALAKACRKNRSLLVLDECFCEFLQEPDRYSFMEKLQDYPEVVVLRAFTKSYAMAGLRLGYALCGDLDLAGRLRRTGQPWSVSVPAQQAGLAALGETEYVKSARALVEEERLRMSRELKSLGFLVFPSQVNFLLFKDLEEMEHGNLWERLRERGIQIRDCSNFCGLEAGGEDFPFHYYRIGIRTCQENQWLLKNIREIVERKLV